jgi:hypothetical protein
VVFLLISKADRPSMRERPSGHHDGGKAVRPAEIED